jgi:hypothetical protein
MAAAGEPREEGEGGVFDIVDYTNSTPLEQVVADVERVLRDWALAAGAAGADVTRAREAALEYRDAGCGACACRVN